MTGPDAEAKRRKVENGNGSAAADVLPETWAPDSWRAKEAKQQPEYGDQNKVKKVINKISTLPPLVHHGEVDRLKSNLAACSRGEAFLLQGGDCAEVFDDCMQARVEGKLKILLQMSMVLIYGSRLPVVRVGRLAGQYAKPRSSPTEVIDGKTVPSYRGDHINGYELEDRDPDPKRMLEAYFHSSATLNYIRASVAGGFTDIRNADHWRMYFSEKHVDTKKAYEDVSRRILDALDFVSTFDDSTHERWKGVDFFTSHEGLLLDYEEAMTRKIEDAGFYNLSAHFLWIGDRTRQLTGAHVEYFRGIRNPIGVKVGPSMKKQELIDLLQIVNPDREEGKVTLISRYGADKIQDYLPDHIAAVKESGVPVVWTCDPMHGNTTKTANGFKTRQFDSILAEISSAFRIHKENNSMLNGVHFELTDESVTECVGGSSGLTESDLQVNYATLCDPRLNFDQSMDMAFLMAKVLSDERKGGLESSSITFPKDAQKKA
eukprot:Clim_evm43s22 gene=Clim_evmTU43s22